MKSYQLLPLVVLALSGCAEEAVKKTPTASTTTADGKTTAVVTNKPVDTADTVGQKSPPAADNSAVNERDKAGRTKTPIDQKENETDIKITADIRKQVVAQSDFSVSAHNVKIITADGKVTLRGPVATEKERDAIAKYAEDAAGKGNVDNQLEIAP